jgi:POT family proton-dependent oligopeptide transporter
MIPLFTYWVYPFFGRFMKVTPLRRIGAGLFIASASFVLVARAGTLIHTGATVSILWQFVAYLVITCAEILISVTALEFSYTQAPNSMKSFVMGLYLLSVTLGNQITAVVNRMIADGSLSLEVNSPEYFWFFAKLMLGTAVVFVGAALLYRGENHIQELPQGV